MTAITTEEAELIAVRLETRDWRCDNTAYPDPLGGFFVNGVFHGNTATALRSLAAERDVLRTERNAERNARFKAEAEFSHMQRRIARQRRALAKLYRKRHDKNGRLTLAEMDARLTDALKWRDAIDDLRSSRWNDPVRDHETPLRAVQRLLNSELAAMALDPEIHKIVKAAIATARKDALEEAAQEMDCACQQRGAVLEKLKKDGPLSHHWPCEKSDDCCALRAAAIRALKGEGDD